MTLCLPRRLCLALDTLLCLGPDLTVNRTAGSCLLVHERRRGVPVTSNARECPQNHGGDAR